MTEIEKTEQYRAQLEDCLNRLILDIGEVPIGKENHMPYGWCKAAKGRSVWRILEEIISQNLRKKALDLGLVDFTPASSEVGVYDFSFRFNNSETLYVNIKSAVQGRSSSKDDISKADKLIAFYEETKHPSLFIATVEIAFLENPIRIKLTNGFVVPTAWLPDIYINPSNNGNLQSARYKNLEQCIRRGRAEFVELLKIELDIARKKRALKGN